MSGEKTDREALHRVRSAAGRRGAAARWSGVDRRQTRTVRAYASDAAALGAIAAASGRRVPDIIHGLLTFAGQSATISSVDVAADSVRQQSPPRGGVN